MSQPRFAAITADLLARKGEAQPWGDPAKKPLAWQKEYIPAPLHPPKRQEKEPPPMAVLHAAEAKKIAVRMSHHDYERLGILAVKQNTTRQRLLQDAVDRLLDGMPLQFGGGCACLGEERFAKGERS